MSYRDLDRVKVLVKEATLLDIGYAYDDLVFSEHAAFMIQFSNDDEDYFFCYFNVDCLEEAKNELFSKLLQTFANHGCHLELKCNFSLNQKGEEIEVAFCE